MLSFELSIHQKSWKSYASHKNIFNIFNQFLSSKSAYVTLEHKTSLNCQFFKI